MWEVGLGEVRGRVGEVRVCEAEVGGGRLVRVGEVGEVEDRVTLGWIPQNLGHLLTERDPGGSNVPGPRATQLAARGRGERGDGSSFRILHFTLPFYGVLKPAVDQRPKLR